jgi:nitrile hydratase
MTERAVVATEFGAHDLGGFAGYGPIAIEEHEPAFHGRWEARVLALTLAVAAWRKWSLDETRMTRERLPPDAYRSLTYYQIWLAALVTQMIDAGLITEDELISGRPAPGPRSTPPLTAENVRPTLAKGSSTLRQNDREPAFKVGDRVTTLNYETIGHTRLPQYARGRTGVIERLHGNHVFPDTNAHGEGENPQPLYTVRFAATDLWWGKAADPRHSVRLDLFEDYLQAEESVSRPGHR